MSNYVKYVNDTVEVDINESVFRRIKRSKKSNHNTQVKIPKCLEKVCIVANYVNNMDPDDDFVDGWHKNLDDIEFPSMLAFMIQPKTIKFEAGSRTDRDVQLQVCFKYVATEDDDLPKGGKDNSEEETEPKDDVIDDGLPFSYREYRDSLTDLGTALGMFDDSLPYVKIGEKRKHVDLVSAAPHACINGYAASNGKFWPYFIAEEVADVLFSATKYGADIDDCIDGFVDGFTVS